MIDTIKWGKFSVGKVFECSTTNHLDTNIAIEGDVPYITRTAENNGLTAYYGNIEFKVKGNCITIGAEGVVAFYQPVDFIPGVKIYTLRNEYLNYSNALYVVTLLNQRNYLYSYGRARILRKIKEETIYLPITKDGKPDWHFMSKYVENLENLKKGEKLSIKNSLKTSNSCTRKSVDINEWKDFFVEDFFEIRKGKRLTKDDQSLGKVPYIGAIDSNNGISNYIGQNAIHKGNTISLSYNGSVGEAFYQPIDFWATDDVNVLYPKKNTKFNLYIALFICTILKQEKYRYSYGRKWVLESMKSTILRLPIDNIGQPDWMFMEKFIKSLPYGDCI